MPDLLERRTERDELAFVVTFVRRCLPLALLASVLPSEAAAVAVPQAHPPSATQRVVRDVEQQIDALVVPYVEAGMFNGVILVAEGEHVRLLKAYGAASYELEEPLHPDSRFRIASLSKQFTNAAIAVLFDRGELQPGTRVSELLPEFPRGDEITVEHLVNHTSGVPHTNELEELRGVTRMSLDEMVALLASKPLDFDPGTHERYSNGGYDLLAALVERASGVSYEEFLRIAVLEPLGLKNTGRLHTYEIVPGLVQGYLPGTEFGGHRQARFYPSEIRIGGGSLYSTASDVFRLFRSTFQRELATEATSDALFWDPTRRYEITGRAPGFVAKVYIDIPGDITVVSLANNYSNLVLWGRRLYQAAIGEPMSTTPFTRTSDPFPHPKDYYAGRFASRWDEGVVSVDDRGTLLWEDEANDWVVALIPLTGERYLHTFFDIICRVEGADRAETLLCTPALTEIEELTRFERVP